MERAFYAGLHLGLPKFIDAMYVRASQPVRIADPKVINELEKTAKKILKLFRHGVKFTPTQPDILRIVKIMLEEKQRINQNKGLPLNKTLPEISAKTFAEMKEKSASACPKVPIKDKRCKKQHDLER